MPLSWHTGSIIIRFIAGLFLCTVVAVSNAPAADMTGEVRAAQELLAAGDYQRAYAEYQRAAGAGGNALAYFALAQFHHHGWGRAVDPVEACRLYETAAEGAIPMAEHFLADCLAGGVHRDADPGLAADWYQKAADHGLVGSLCSLAELLIAGNGVDQDIAAGLARCQQAASQGVSPAMVRLGRFYLEGDLGAVDFGLAAQWFEQAANARSGEGAYRLAVMARDGQGLEPNAAKARELFELAADWGYAPAYFQTATLYFNAPVNPDTKMPDADNLAKTYMWLAATAAVSEDADETAEAEKMLNKVLSVMPESWIADLNARVEAHLASFAVPSKAAQ